MRHTTTAPGSARRPSRPAARSLAAAATLTLLAAALSGCDGSGFSAAGDGPSQGQGRASASASPSAAPVTITSNPEPDAAGVAVDTVVEVRAKGGRLRSVTLRSDAGEVPGTIAADGSSWTASRLLEPGQRYRMSVAAGSGDDAVTRDSGFTTVDLTRDQQVFASVAPLAGETVGVGMPVVVNFDLPVTDRAAFEKRMKVTSVPAQNGSWSWLSDKVAHWRPETYWQPGTKVRVAIDVNSVPAGGGLYGQKDRDVSFTVGDAHIYKVNAKTHQMKVFSNGALVRTLPITTGKEGFTTRSGTKVIMEKFATRRMNSETVGIAAGSAEAYDIDDVRWAMRLTTSGEFIHAAPWSVGSQGRANVSHGCTGMSTENAAWLYRMTRRGDVVEYVGTDRPMEPGNGWGDWNVPFAQYAEGSALG